MYKLRRRAEFSRIGRLIWIGGLLLGTGIGIVAAIGVIGYAPASHPTIAP